MTQPAQETAQATTPPTLESVISGSITTVVIDGRTFKLKKWGLRKTLQLGSRVMRLLAVVREYIKDQPQAAQDDSLMLEILAVCAQDVLFIVAESLAEHPGDSNSTDSAVAWMDDNIALADLFTLAKTVYEQNLSGDRLGKVLGGLNNLTGQVQSLSK